MQKKTSLWLFSLLVLLLTFCGTKKNNSSCQFKKIETLFSYGTPSSKGINTYVHYVLLRKFSRECMDSATIVKIVLKYIDTVSESKPIDMIKIFSDSRDFIPNEISQDMQKINKSCLVTIGFNLLTKKPDEFVFYNENGEIVYWGKKWDPFPKKNDLYTTPQ